MAVTSAQIVDFLTANPGMTDAQIVAAMEQYGISPAQMAGAVGIPEGQIASRVAATVQPGQTVTLGDTIVQPVHETVGSGQDQQIGGIQNVITYKVGENQTGGGYNQYSASGVLERTGTQEKVDTSLGGAVKQLVQNPGFQIGALAYGANSLFGGGGAATGVAGTVGSTGLTMAELAQLDISLGGVGGTAGATTLANALMTGATIPTLTALTGGSGILTGAAGGITAESVAAKLAADTAATSTAGLLTPAATSTIPAATSTTIPSAVTSTLPTAAAATTAATALTPAVTSALTPTATTIASSLIPAAVKGLLTPTNIGNLITGGATTAAGLLQQQTSKEAATKAQAMIDTETAAAKQSAQFRPVGMTTRFGTSQFGFDPITGQLTSAGYTLDPQAKNAQDRLVKLAESGLQQAEGAQAQFAPLQTGAQSLFGLGNQYLAQSPQNVAQNYLNQQMALLQPGRETELANLQNKLQQQGRGGLSVAQGGTMGATTPELQALYNARAQQEAQLAANAQQYGQQNVLFGAGLLGQGASALGNYYAGQQAAYQPYTTALGQVQGLEQLAQQPLTMGAALGQQSAQAGFNVGQLGLKGAGQSVALATSPAATNNPYASALSGLGASNAFGQAIGNVASGLFGSTPATSGFSYGQYGTGIDPSTGEYFGSLYF
jgi:hypothetical protein